MGKDGCKQVSVQAWRREICSKNHPRALGQMISLCHHHPPPTGYCVSETPTLIFLVTVCKGHLLLLTHPNSFFLSTSVTTLVPPYNTVAILHSNSLRPINPIGPPTPQWTYAGGTLVSSKLGTEQVPQCYRSKGLQRFA